MEAEDILYAEGVYRSFAELPTITGGVITKTKDGSNVKISLTKNQKDVVNNSKNKLLSEFYVSTQTPSLIVEPTLFPLSPKTVLHLPSPTGKFSLRLIKEDSDKKGGSDGPNFVFEIYDRSGRLHRVESQGVHGQVFLGHPFGSVVWSPCETKIGYVAERKKKDRLKLFSQDKDAKSGEDGVNGMRSEFEYEDDFGEQMNGAQQPVPFIIDLGKAKVTIQPVNISEEFSTLAFGQFQFTPKNDLVVAVGWRTTPRRFGIIYYNTRPSKLYMFNVKGPPATKCITPNEEDYSVCNPRFSPSGANLAYLTTRKTAVHNSCSCLRLVPWKSVLETDNAAPETIIDYVEVPNGPGGFCGLFDQGTWPKQPFLNEETIIFSSLHRSILKICCVNLATKALSTMPLPLALEANETVGYCASALFARDNTVLWKFNRPNCPDRCFVSQFGEEGGVQHLEISREKCRSALPSHRIFSMEKDGMVLEGLLSLPSNGGDKLPPLILSPHGGPHSATMSSFNATICTLNHLGFAVLQVNYRGSLGYGLRSLESLPGKVGRQDVDDCMSILNEALQSGECSKSEVFVLGGSHGGFLTGHLIAQFPDRFRAAAARNPVLNMAGEFVATDIPDWCHVEAGTGVDVVNDGLPYVPTPQIYSLLYETSPISLVNSVKTPLMLMVGGADIRVPWAQSFDFFHILRSKGVPVKLLAYPKMQHALADFSREEADVWINVIMWFSKFVKERGDLDPNFCTARAL
jgi:acylaminoacyl-peptidase